MPVPHTPQQHHFRNVTIVCDLSEEFMKELRARNSRIFLRVYLQELKHQKSVKKTGGKKAPTMKAVRKSL